MNNRDRSVRRGRGGGEAQEEKYGMNRWAKGLGELRHDGDSE